MAGPFSDIPLGQSMQPSQSKPPTFDEAFLEVTRGLPEMRLKRKDLRALRDQAQRVYEMKYNAWAGIQERATGRPLAPEEGLLKQARAQEITSGIEAGIPEAKAGRLQSQARYDDSRAGYYAQKPDLEREGYRTRLDIMRAGQEGQDRRLEQSLESRKRIEEERIRAGDRRTGLTLGLKRDLFNRGQEEETQRLEQTLRSRENITDADRAARQEMFYGDQDRRKSEFDRRQTLEENKFQARLAELHAKRDREIAGQQEQAKPDGRANQLLRAVHEWRQGPEAKALAEKASGMFGSLDDYEEAEQQATEEIRQLLYEAFPSMENEQLLGIRNDPDFGDLTPNEQTLIEAELKRRGL